MRTAWYLLLKDLRLEGRGKDILSTTLFFASLTVLIMGFAFGPDSGNLQRAAAGVLWVTLSFASLLAAGRAFGSEQDNGALEALLSYPVAHEWLYLGKAAANIVLMLLLALVAVLLVGLLFGVSYASYSLLALTVFLGIIGLCLINTFYAAITINLRAKEALLPVLSFPIVIPIVIGAVKSTLLLTSSSSDALNLDDYWAWTRLLIGFDLLSLLVATFAFPYALEN